MEIHEEFLSAPQHHPAARYFLMKNSGGMSVRASTYGAGLLSMCVPSREGFQEVLVRQTAAAPDHELGRVLGRCAGRIENARLLLDDNIYRLTPNQGWHHYNGGKVGFSRRIWDATIGEDMLSFSYHSPDGEEGYPGALDATVHYRLWDDNTFSIEYEAHTTKTTICGLSNRLMFHFHQSGEHSLYAHSLAIAAQKIATVDTMLSPDGGFRPTAGTAFDFSSPTMLAKNLALSDEQLQLAGGYAHNFVLEHPAISPCATLYHPDSGIGMELSTDYPSLYVYLPKAAQKTLPEGIILSPGVFNNAAWWPHLPSPVLPPGETSRFSQQLRFFVD